MRLVVLVELEIFVAGLIGGDVRACGETWLLGVLVVCVMSMQKLGKLVDVANPVQRSQVVVGCERNMPFAVVLQQLSWLQAGRQQLVQPVAKP